MKHNIKSKLNQIKLLIHNKCYKALKSKNYLVLYHNHNKRLFRLLDEAAFFDFHITNNKLIVGLHQIVAYIYKGYKAYYNGYTVSKGEVEVHHINSNTSDNSPGNLVYVSTQEHILISQASLNYNSFSIVKSAAPCPFNNKGLPVINPLKRLSYLVFITIKRTFHSLGISSNIPYVAILLEVPSLYTIKRVNWCPKFIKRLYLSLEQQCL